MAFGLPRFPGHATVSIALHDRSKRLPLLPDCVTLWIGPELGPLERACLRSVVRAGHRITLYCYDVPTGVPEGVELADAGAVVSRDRIIRYRNGSFALFANLFRYEVQRQQLGTWIDCDVYLLKPLPGQDPYLVGEFEDGQLNNAILRLPPDCPMLPPLLALFDGKSVPPALPWRPWIAARLRLLLTGKVDVADMPWGATGPRALTALWKSSGADVRPLPPAALYPVRWQQAEWVAEPGSPMEDRIAPETIAIHLWNERIKHLKERPAARGSFLRRLQEEGA
jgi:hypothetical protein